MGEMGERCRNGGMMRGWESDGGTEKQYEERSAVVIGQ